jgi:hypothetical protein
VQLTNVEWAEIIPSYWSMDGQTIYAYGLGGPGGQGSNIWAVSVSDGTARPLLDLSNSMKETISLSSDGERLFLSIWEREGDLWMAELSADE